MVKRLFAFFLSATLSFSFCSCAKEGDEIAKENFGIDKNQVLADGFSAFGDRLQGIYDDPDDLVELGGQNIMPVVDFDDAVYISAGDYKCYTRFLYYILVELKSGDISNALLYGINAENDDSFWNSYGVDTNITRRDVVYKKAEKYARDLIISNAIMKEYDFTPSNNYQLSYDNLLSLYGNEQAINDYYGAYGLGDDLLLPYLKIFSAYSEFKEFLVGTDGELYPTDEQAKKFFRDECIYMEQIVFSYVYTNEDGYTYPKTAEEIADARSRGQAVYESILEDQRMFDRNMHLTEHHEWSENVHGYTYIPDEILPELEEAYLKLKPGEIVAVDTPLGYYILRALEKTDKAYEESNSRIIDAYREKVFNALMEKNSHLITVNEGELQRYPFDKILVFEN